MFLVPQSPQKRRVSNCMNFYDLKVGDYVRWSKHLRGMWQQLPETILWDEGENGFDCIFEVMGVDHRENEPEVEISCVADCGCHGISSFTLSEYEDNCSVLGDNLLQHADSMVHLASKFDTGVKVEHKRVLAIDGRFPLSKACVKDEYDLEEDIQLVLELL